MQVFAVKEETSEDDLLTPMLESWELVSLDDQGFELFLNFSNPLLISTGDEKDLLLI